MEAILEGRSERDVVIHTSDAVEVPIARMVGREEKRRQPEEEVIAGVRV